MEKLAPIAIFIYNRPNHLRWLLNDLLQCAEFSSSAVTVFGDGPQSKCDIEEVELARAVAMEVLGSEATYKFLNVNIGLAKSVVAGVSEICEASGRVIVLEDDLRVSPTFLKFMNEALEEYSDCEKVFQISGHMFDVAEFEGRMTALMLPFTTTWGWATWSRAWDKFDAEAKGAEVLNSDGNLRKRFNLNNRYDYTTMLNNYLKGKNSSWGIRWYWSVFQGNGMVLYPPQTLVRNAGFDGSGTHGIGRLRKISQNSRRFTGTNISLPLAEIDSKLYDIVGDSIYRANGGWVGRVVDKFKSVLAVYGRKKQ